MACSFKNLLLRKRYTDFHETWYVASGTRAHHSFYKRWPWDDICQGQIWSHSQLYGKKWKPFKLPPFNPYILMFLMMRHIQWHGPWVPRGMPRPFISLKANISETIYILVSYVKRHSVTQTLGPRSHSSPLHFIKGLIAQKPFTSPPLKHKYFRTLW